MRCIGSSASSLAMYAWEHHDPIVDTGIKNAIYSSSEHPWPLPPNAVWSRRIGSVSYLQPGA